MKNRSYAKTLFVLAFAVILGFGATAVAGPGWGSGRGGYGPGMMAYGPQMMGPGYGMGPGMMGYGPGAGRGSRGYGYAADMSAEDLKKLDEQREAFFTGTASLRNDIYQKRLELRSELAKQNPDVEKAGTLQREISGLKAEFDQKRLAHRIEIKKINPNVGRGFAGRGPGAYGFGPRGECWR